MDYEREVGAFENWLVTNRLDASAQLVWYKLVHIASTSGWPDAFYVTGSRLESVTGLSRSAAFKARNRLKQAGLIEMTIPGGNKSARYRLLPFHSVFYTHTPRDIQRYAPQDTPRDTPQDARRDLKVIRREEEDINNNSACARVRESPKTAVELFAYHFGPATDKQAGLILDLCRRYGELKVWEAVTIAAMQEYPPKHPVAYIEAILANAAAGGMEL